MLVIFMFRFYSHYLLSRYGSNRGEGGAPSNAGTTGFQPGRPTSTKKEPLKFDNDYDFEQANEEFKEFLSKFEVCLVYSFLWYI